MFKFVTFDDLTKNQVRNCKSRTQNSSDMVYIHPKIGSLRTLKTGLNLPSPIFDFGCILSISLGTFGIHFKIGSFHNPFLHLFYIIKGLEDWIFTQLLI